MNRQNITRKVTTEFRHGDAFRINDISLFLSWTICLVNIELFTKWGDVAQMQRNPNVEQIWHFEIKVTKCVHMHLQHQKGQILLIIVYKWFSVSDLYGPAALASNFRSHIFAYTKRN